jgi:hypothetical protein
MPRFRVSDLMINVGEGAGGCHLITNCGGVTELCVENTQGCAFTANCNCTIHTFCDEFSACQCSICTPCSARTCGCTPCTGGCTVCSQCTQTCGPVSPCTFRSVCTFNSLCGVSIRCTPTFIGGFAGGLQPEHLSQLKEELRSTLEQVEAEEQRLKERMQPQTLEEVTELEQKMGEALDELRRRREELERQEQGEGK